MRNKKRKVFRPAKIPRYLPGSVPRAYLQNDLHDYNTHRYKVFSAKKIVDDDSPVMNPYNFIDKRKLVAEGERLRQIAKENRQLLIKINKINRTKGMIDSYNPAAYDDKSQWRKHELAMLRIEKENRSIYKRLVAAASFYSKNQMDKFWNDVLTQMHYTCKYPLFFLEKKPTLDEMIANEPSISSGLPLQQNSKERLHCFMVFKLKDGPVLGRIVIELYNDYTPVTVQNFLAICNGEQNLSYKNCEIHNIVRGQYIETGDITKGNGKGGVSIYGKTFDEENFTLKHKKAGVLSMKRVKRRQNNSQFSITLSKMETFDGKRVAFGKVIKGISTLFKIEDLGKKVGKPQTPIIISDCGECTSKGGPWL